MSLLDSCMPGRLSIASGPYYPGHTESAGVFTSKSCAQQEARGARFLLLYRCSISATLMLSCSRSTDPIFDRLSGLSSEPDRAMPLSVSVLDCFLAGGTRAV
jgi:hypothetical protein